MCERSLRIGFFTPTNSNKSYIDLWFNQISEPDGHTIIWVANRQNPLVGGSAGALLSVTLDGHLTVTSSNKTAVWTSPNSTVKVTRAVAQLLDSGNLVVKQQGGKNYGWQGFNYLTDTLISGMRFGLDRTTGISRTLVAWTSATDPSPGAIHVRFPGRKRRPRNLLVPRINAGVEDRAVGRQPFQWRRHTRQEHQQRLRRRIRKQRSGSRLLLQ